MPTQQEIIEYLQKFHRDEYDNVLLNSYYWPKFKAWVLDGGDQPIGAKFYRHEGHPHS